MNRPYQHSNYKRGGHQSREKIKFDMTFNPEWIKEGANQKMIEFTKELGHFLKEHRISSSQLRNIYGEITRIKLKGIQNETPAFWLLKPKIAYNAARIDRKNEKDAFNELVKVLNQAIDSVDVQNAKTFDNFQKFFEAILAYHKFYGGK